MRLYFTFLTLCLCQALIAADPMDPVKIFGRWNSKSTNPIEITVGFDIEEPGFRVYRESIKVSMNGVPQQNLPLPAGEKKLDPFTKKEKEVYLQKTSWPLLLELGGKQTPPEIEIAVTYRACNDKNCHFPKTKKITVSQKKPAAQANVLGSLERFWELLNHVDADRIKALAAQHMWLALLLCFASGILTSLTPCVYPMIPITINIFGRAAQEKSQSSSRVFNFQTFSLAGIYVAGMCTTYSLMGVVAGMTGSLFGKVLQSSFMLGFLTLLFFILALGQLGAFKMALPASWQTKLAQIGSADNPKGIFLMGLFSGLIVSPCVGPVIAGILAFVFDTSNAFIGFIYFLSFSLGLGVLFLLIGGFSGILGKLPRSGPWMMRVNRTLAALMLFAAGYYGLVWAKQVGVIQQRQSQMISWKTIESEALTIASQKKQPVIIDFTAEWCGACHELDATVFSNEKVKEALTRFVPLRLDVTAENEANAELLKKYGIMSLPAIVFIDSEGKLKEQPRVNGVVSVESFLASLETIR